MNKYIHKIIGIFFIIIGIVLYPTPIPGTTLLIILGFVWFMGKNKTLIFLKRVLNKKIFIDLKIKSLVKKI